MNAPTPAASGVTNLEKYFENLYPAEKTEALNKILQTFRTQGDNWIKQEVIVPCIYKAIDSVRKDRLRKIFECFHIQPFERKLTLFELIAQRCYMYIYVCESKKFIEWSTNFPREVLAEILYFKSFKITNDLTKFKRFTQDLYDSLKFIDKDAVEQKVCEKIYPQLDVGSFRMIFKTIVNFEENIWINGYLQTPLEEIFPFQDLKIDPTTRLPFSIVKDMELYRELLKVVVFLSSSPEDHAHFEGKKKATFNLINSIPFHLMKLRESLTPEKGKLIEDLYCNVLRKFQPACTGPKLRDLLHLIQTKWKNKINETLRQYGSEFSPNDLNRYIVNTDKLTKIIYIYINKIVRVTEQHLRYSDVIYYAIYWFIYLPEDVAKIALKELKDLRTDLLFDEVLARYSLFLKTNSKDFMQKNYSVSESTEFNLSQFTALFSEIKADFHYIASHNVSMFSPMIFGMWRIYSNHVAARNTAASITSTTPAKKKKKKKVKPVQQEQVDVKELSVPFEGDAKVAPPSIVVKVEASLPNKTHECLSLVDQLKEKISHSPESTSLSTCLNHLNNASFSITFLQKFESTIANPLASPYIKKTLSVVLCHLSIEQTLRAAEYYANNEDGKLLILQEYRSPHNLLQLFKNCYVKLEPADTFVIKLIPTGSVVGRYPFSYDTTLAKSFQSMLSRWLEGFSKRKDHDFVFLKRKNLNFAEEYAQDTLNGGLQICASLLKCEPKLTSLVETLLRKRNGVNTDKLECLNNALFHLSLIFSLHEFLQIADKDVKPLAAYGIFFYLFPMIEQIIAFYSEDDIAIVFEDTLTHDLSLLANKYVPINLLSSSQMQFLKRFKAGTFQTRYPFYHSHAFDKEFGEILERSAAFVRGSNSTVQCGEDDDSRQIVNLTIKFLHVFLNEFIKTL